MYSVKEIFYTLQGEGAQAGRPAVFCRFTGCNLWSGREQDRATAICRFCDTDFVGTDGFGGGKFDSAKDLAEEIHSFWPAQIFGDHYVVLTGGEPMLQVDEGLVCALKYCGFTVAIETNGTIPVPALIDWICVSPKPIRGALRQSRGNELKLVYPQSVLGPEMFDGASFDHCYLQPMDGPDQQRNTQLAIKYCLANPKWKLSLQTHKLVGLR